MRTQLAILLGCTLVVIGFTSLRTAQPAPAQGGGLSHQGCLIRDIVNLTTFDQVTSPSTYLTIPGMSSASIYQVPPNRTLVVTYARFRLGTVGGANDTERFLYLAESSGGGVEYKTGTPVSTPFFNLPNIDRFESEHFGSQTGLVFEGGSQVILDNRGSVSADVSYTIAGCLH